MTENDNQSAELRRFEDLVGKSWKDMLAWMKNREATERLLLGMVEKLTLAAEERWCPHCGAPNWTTDGNHLPSCPNRPDPPKTPAPACEHIDAEYWAHGLKWCQDCGAIRRINGVGWHIPRQTPVSREEPKRPPLVSG